MSELDVCRFMKVARSAATSSSLGPPFSFKEAEIWQEGQVCVCVSVCVFVNANW